VFKVEHNYHNILHISYCGEKIEHIKSNGLTAISVRKKDRRITFTNSHITEQKTSPLSSWFLSPGGAPNFGKPDQEAAEYTQIRTSGGTGKGELVTALNKEIEENDEFTQQLLASLAEGALDHQQTNNTISIPGSPST
jgi:hypothetical protein